MAAGHCARQLTESESLKLQQEECISEFKREKLEKEARKNWDLFYKRNSNHFFKDRHWLSREFPELVQVLSDFKVCVCVLTCVYLRMSTWVMDTTHCSSEPLHNHHMLFMAVARCLQVLLPAMLTCGWAQHSLKP